MRRTTDTPDEMVGLLDIVRRNFTAPASIPEALARLPRLSVTYPGFIEASPIRWSTSPEGKTRLERRVWISYAGLVPILTWPGHE